RAAPLLGWRMTLLSGAISGDLKKMVIGLVVIAVIQAIDGAVINPKLLSSSIEVHPMLVILALIIGSKIGGLGGMLLSVPCAALVKVWFERYIDFMESRKTAAALPEPPAEDETT
ncbi:MAG: AI-2E family transporter, partial [Oscillospiraceae bacterium]|nr:AI-2E family transporter [Oscillospiraceae bacterium]